MNNQDLEELKKELGQADLTLFAMTQGELAGVEQDAIDAFRTAFPKLIEEIERQREIIERCARYPVIGARYARDYVATLTPGGSNAK